MRSARLILAVCFLSSALGPSPASAACGSSFVTDPTLVLTPPTMTKPPLRGSYTDPVLGGCVMRITDWQALGEDDPVHYYSRLQAWNADGSLMIIKTFSKPGLIEHIYDASTFQRLLTVRYNNDVPDYGRIRWSATDPLVLYYTGVLQSGSDGIACGVGQARLMRIRLTPGNPMTEQHELVRCFAEYTDILKDEPHEEPSNDGRYMSLVAHRPNGTVDIFSYDLVANQKGAVFNVPSAHTNDVGSVLMSPSGKYILASFGTGTGQRYTGVEAYDRATMQYVGKVSLTTGHADVTMDTNGNEFYIQDNSENAVFLNDKEYIIKAKIPNGVVFNAQGAVDAQTTVNSGATVPLFALQQGTHISCRNIRNPTFCVVSTQSGVFPQRVPMEDEIIKVYLDSTASKPHIERIAQHRSDPEWVNGSPTCPTDGYWAQPHASVNQGGTKIIFGSSWGRNCNSEAFIVQANNGPSPSPPTGLRLQ